VAVASIIVWIRAEAAPTDAFEKKLTGSTSTVTRTAPGTFTAASQAFR
jgi:hypothetical protein